MTNQTDLISSVRAALQAATPGPWKVFRFDETNETLIGTEYDHPQLKSPDSVVGHLYGKNGEAVYIRQHDAELIANAPAWLRQLSEMLEESDIALDLSIEETKRWSTLANSAMADNERLRRRLEEAVKALEWYGDERKYELIEVRTEESGIEFVSDSLQDEGLLARTTLKRIKGENSHE